METNLYSHLECSPKSQALGDGEGQPDVLHFTGLQRVGHNLVTEKQPKFS